MISYFEYLLSLAFVKLLLNLKSKLDNGHGLMAQSAWMPHYSTELLIKIRIMIILLIIDLRALVDSNATISQKISFRSCIFITLVPWCTSQLYIRTLALFARCHSTHAHLTLLPEVCLLPLDPNNVTCHIFLVPSKVYWHTLHDKVMKCFS